MYILYMLRQKFTYDTQSAHETTLALQQNASLGQLVVKFTHCLGVRTNKELNKH